MMLVTAVSGKSNAAIPHRAGSPPMQHLLLLCGEKAEILRLNGYLGGIYHLFPVKTQSQMFDVLENQPIHLIIIHREGGNLREGMEICSCVKSMPSFAHLPVVLLIPRNNAEARIGCLQSGADAWMEKPFSRDHLRAQIKNLLANRRLVHSHFTRSLPYSQYPTAARKEDGAFMSRLNSFIIEHLSDACLNVDGLARLMNISLPTLYRKIKSVSDTTPNELINIVRLTKAAELLTFGGYKVFEIVKLVGFHSRSNFGKAFVKQFGLTPKEYQQMTRT